MLAFAAKVMRGTDQLDSLMDAALAKDALLAPEVGGFGATPSSKLQI